MTPAQKYLNSLTPEILQDVQRTKKILCDRRNEETNTRRQIYEIEPDKIYLYIEMQNGEIKRTTTTQNALTLFLNHF